MLPRQERAKTHTSNPSLHNDSLPPEIITFSPALHSISPRALYLYSTLAFLISLLSAITAISYLYCPQHVDVLRPICEDQHYKYLVPLLVPVTAWFSIANWVGWEYFRYA